MTPTAVVEQALSHANPSIGADFKGVATALKWVGPPLTLLLLTSCNTPTAQTPPPATATLLECSHVVGQGEGWSHVGAALGSANGVLVNGSLTPEGTLLHEGQYTVLQKPPASCKPADVNLAHDVEFSNMPNGGESSLNVIPATATRLQVDGTIFEACKDVRANDLNPKLGTASSGNFTADLSQTNGAGCNLPTGIKFSTADGTVSGCISFPTAMDASNALATTKNVSAVAVRMVPQGADPCK